MGKQIRSDSYTGPVPEEPAKKEADAAIKSDFENLLRVDESDESPEKGKKQKAEEEEDKKKKETPETETPTSDAFQRFMTDKNSGDSPFGVKSPQNVQGISTSQETEAVKPKPKAAAPQAQTKSVATPQPEQELLYVPEPETPTAEPAPAPAPTSSAKQATPAPAPKPTPTPTQATTPTETTTQTSEPSPSPTPSQEVQPTTQTKEEQPTHQQSQQPTTSSSTTTTTETQGTTTTDTGEAPTTDSEPDLPGDTPNTIESALEEAVPFPITEGVGMLLGDEALVTGISAAKGKFKKEDFPINSIKGAVPKVAGEESKIDQDSYMAEIGAFPAGTAPPALPEALMPTEAPSAYSSLSKQIRELFSYMVGTIMVKKDADQTTTTVTVNLKGSIFDGSKIVLTRFATAPDALNVQLQGDPKAVNIFTENLAALRQAFAEKKMNIHLQAPILLDEYFKKRKKEAKTVSRKKSK